MEAVSSFVRRSGTGIACKPVAAIVDRESENQGWSALVRAAVAVVGLLALLVPHGAAGQKKRTEVADATGAGSVFRDCPICPEMVVLPAGEFMMGSPESEKGRNTDEGPLRKITLSKPVAMGKFEVTFAQWDACVAEGGCAHKPGDESWGRGRRPVINVSWDDARQFVAWLAKKTGKPYRLPTEAEWEYAARGITKASEPHAPFSTGATINYKQANYDANFRYGNSPQGVYRQKTLDVGSLPRNTFGLHDMHGNVWEWVEDCYKDTYAGAPTDGTAVTSASCALRILRGGSWNYYPQLLRAAYRYATVGGIRVENAGFRVARAL